MRLGSVRPPAASEQSSGSLTLAQGEVVALAPAADLWEIRWDGPDDVVDVQFGDAVEVEGRVPGETTAILERVDQREERYRILVTDERLPPPPPPVPVQVPPPPPHADHHTRLRVGEVWVFPEKPETPFSSARCLTGFDLRINRRGPIVAVG